MVSGCYAKTIHLITYSLRLLANIGATSRTLV